MVQHPQESRRLADDAVRLDFFWLLVERACRDVICREVHPAFVAPVLFVLVFVPLWRGLAESASDRPFERAAQRLDVEAEEVREASCGSATSSSATRPADFWNGLKS